MSATFAEVIEAAAALPLWVVTVAVTAASAAAVWALRSTAQHVGGGDSSTNASRQRGPAATIVQVPPGALPYKRVPAEGAFTPATILQGLLARHSTKAGVWGQINVVRGKLKLFVLEGDKEEVVLSPLGSSSGNAAAVATPGVGVVAPQQHHRVEPLTDDMQMFIVFHAMPDGSGAVAPAKRGGVGFG